MDETENVLQQEYSTGHRPRLARQAALNAATEHGETTLRQELVEHLYCLNGEELRRSAEIHVFGTSIFWWRLVMF